MSDLYHYGYQALKEGKYIEGDIKALSMKCARAKLKTRRFDRFSVAIKKNMVIAFEGGKLTPRNLLLTAEHYLTGCQLISKNYSNDISLWKVRYFLLGHSLELGFKAFLYKKGYSLGRLANEIGHNLNKCLEDSRKKGFILGFDEIKRIQLLNKYYKKSDFEYEKMGFKSLPLLMDIESIVIKVLNEVKDI